ncbi:MAG: hypothetical protein ACOC31_00890 [Bacteroidota bacterium]
MKKRSFFYASAISVILMLSNFNSNAQRGYTTFTEEEGIKVMYKWQRAVFYKKDSDAVLNLRISNQKEAHVLVNFGVGFYKDGLLLLESDENQLCMKPGQTKRGGLAGLRFAVEDMKKEDAKDESYSWEFTTFDVAETDECIK